MIVSNEEIITALLSHKTVMDAARALDVNHNTLRNRMKTQEFQSEYKQARQDMLKAACNDLIAGITDAVKTVRDVMMSNNSSAQIKLNAAQIYLNTVLRLNEQIDVIQDIEEIKERMRGLEHE